MTMRHLTLICMAGISTSLLVNKMKRLIRNENFEIAVTAMSERAFQGYTGQTDVLLLGTAAGTSVRKPEKNSMSPKAST